MKSKLLMVLAICSLCASCVGATRVSSTESDTVEHVQVLCKYSTGMQYVGKLIKFPETDTLYVMASNGSVTPLIKEDGSPVTYQEWSVSNG